MEHVATAPEPASVQLVNVPVPLLDSVTVPVGVRAGDGDVSVTVTAQLVKLPTSVLAG